MKAVCCATQATVSNQVVTVVGTVVLPSISRNELNSMTFPFLNVTETEKSKNSQILYLTEEIFESKDSLEKWWNGLYRHISNIQSPHLSTTDNQVIENIAGEMITSMCIVHSYLPRVTSNTGDKITTLLLNQNHEMSFSTKHHGKSFPAILEVVSQFVSRKLQNISIEKMTARRFFTSVMIRLVCLRPKYRLTLKPFQTMEDFSPFQYPKSPCRQVSLSKTSATS